MYLKKEILVYKSVVDIKSIIIRRRYYLHILHGELHLKCRDVIIVPLLLREYLAIEGLYAIGTNLSTRVGASNSIHIS